MIAFASSLDQAGPLTRDVTDAALMLRHMVGRDRRDSTSLDYPGEIALPRAEDLNGIRLGVPEELIGSDGGSRAGRARELRRDAERSPRDSARPSSRASYRTRRTRCRPTT